MHLLTKLNPFISSKSIAAA